MIVNESRNEGIKEKELLAIASPTNNMDKMIDANGNHFQLYSDYINQFIIKLEGCKTSQIKPYRTIGYDFYENQTRNLYGLSWKTAKQENLEHCSDQTVCPENEKMRQSVCAQVSVGIHFIFSVKISCSNS